MPTVPCRSRLSVYHGMLISLCYGNHVVWSHSFYKSSASMLALTFLGSPLPLQSSCGSLEHDGCHITCHMGQNVWSGKADSHFYHVRLNTVKRRKTSGCKKKKQKCNSCPWSFSLGKQEVVSPGAEQSCWSREESSDRWGALNSNLEGTSWLSSSHSGRLASPDLWWYYDYVGLHHPSLLVSFS